SSGHWPDYSIGGPRCRGNEPDSSRAKFSWPKSATCKFEDPNPRLQACSLPASLSCYRHQGETHPILQELPFESSSHDTSGAPKSLTVPKLIFCSWPERSESTMRIVASVEAAISSKVIG